jgi:hypothetical protein
MRVWPKGQTLGVRDMAGVRDKAIAGVRGRDTPVEPGDGTAQGQTVRSDAASPGIGELRVWPEGQTLGVRDMAGVRDKAFAGVRGRDTARRAG